MADRDDIERELAECAECGSAYAARQLPTGDIQPIGSETCDCGSTEFRLIEDVDDESASSELTEE
nr:hypothetical protein [Natronorubrum halophilum]